MTRPHRNDTKGMIAIDKDLYQALLRDSGLVKAVDEPDFTPNEDLGEGAVSEMEFTYRKELLATLALIYPAISKIINGNRDVEEKITKVDEYIDQFTTNAQKIATNHTTSTWTAAVTSANSQVKAKTDKFKSTATPDTARLDIIQTQQLNNVEDIALTMRGRIRQGLLIAEVQSAYEFSEDQIDSQYDYLDSAFNTAQTNLDKAGMYGWIESHKAGQLETFIIAGTILGAVIVAPWEEVGDDTVCEECLDLAANGPYSILFWPANPHFGCRCTQGEIEIIWN